MPGREQRPRGPGRQVLLTQVHTVGADGQGQIDPIVDDERGAGRGAGGAKPLGQRQEPARRPLLVAQLDHPAAAGQGQGQEIDEVAPMGRGAVQHDVERRIHPNPW